MPVTKRTISEESEEQRRLEQATAVTGDLSPRALLVFAHPDDETIALGARLARFADASLVHVTDGAPRNGEDCRVHGFATLEAYRVQRRRELAEALQSAGAGRVRCESLGFADQEAALHLQQVTLALVRLLEAFRPEVVFTHPYEGGHPDHDACAFAVQHAVAAHGTGAKPLVVEAPFYHRGPAGGMQTGQFLAHPSALEVERRLSPEESDRKRQMLGCFRTQKQTLAQFGVECERFRVSPGYDFTRPPHAGPALYDTWRWAMTTPRFNALAGEAVRSLDEVPACR